jgi:hypothetical protein
VTEDVGGEIADDLHPSKKMRTEDKPVIRLNLTLSVPQNSTRLSSEETRAALMFVEKLRNHQSAAPFLLPVDTNLYPNYTIIVKRPMDLTTIQRRINSGYYNSLTDVIVDVRQIFSNCYLYNMEDSPVYDMAKRLEAYFNHDLLPNLNQSQHWNEPEFEGLEKKDRRCAEVMITKLLSQPFSYFFAAPVDPIRDGAPDYLIKIRHPMDLGTIQSKVKGNKYQSLFEFERDVNLVFDNCFTYNTNPMTAVYQGGKQLQNLWQKEWQRLLVRRDSKAGLTPMSPYPGSAGFYSPLPVGRSSTMADNMSMSGSETDGGDKTGPATTIKLVTAPQLPSIPEATSREKTTSPGPRKERSPSPLREVMDVDADEEKPRVEVVVPSVVPPTGATSEKPEPQAPETPPARPPTATIVIKTPGTVKRAPSKMNLDVTPERKVQLQELVENVKKQPNAHPFLLPVDYKTLGLWDYPKIIKKPMDLKTMEDKLKVGGYVELKYFESDLRQIFTNCRKYNTKDAPVVTMADEVEKFAVEQLNKLKSEWVGSGDVSANEDASAVFDLTRLRAIHKKLFNHPAALWFRMPVDPIAQNVPQYFDVIKNPMDLGTVGKKLKSGQYTSNEEFEADMRLIFTNCYTFNGPQSEPSLQAGRLEKLFEKLMASAVIKK